MGFFRDFHEHGRFMKSLNASFLVIIPKKEEAKELQYFRLVRLVDSLYKLLAKVLANKIKKVLGKVASCSQNAFMEGRQILEASLIVNEAIKSLLKSNDCGLICKLDRFNLQV